MAAKGGLGKWGEDRAVRFLEDLDWTIEVRNFDSPFGECDIIAWDDDVLVFVEVKTRRNHQFGPPECAVTAEKRDHLRKIARHYLSTLDDSIQCRFDVLALTFHPNQSEINHIKNAFGATE